MFRFVQSQHSFKHNKHHERFDVTIEIVSKNGTFAFIPEVCGVLLSYFTEEVGSYSMPKLKIGISSTSVKIVYLLRICQYYNDSLLHIEVNNSSYHVCCLIIDMILCEDQRENLQMFDN